jgi:hypothetical protein
MLCKANVSAIGVLCQDSDPPSLNEDYRNHALM